MDHVIDHISSGDPKRPHQLIDQLDEMFHGLLCVVCAGNIMKKGYPIVKIYGESWFTVHFSCFEENHVPGKPFKKKKQQEPSEPVIVKKPTMKPIEEFGVVEPCPASWGYFVEDYELVTDKYPYSNFVCVYMDCDKPVLKEGYPIVVSKKSIGNCYHLSCFKKLMDSKSKFVDPEEYCLSAERWRIISSEAEAKGAGVAKHYVCCLSTCSLDEDDEPTDEKNVFSKGFPIALKDGSGSNCYHLECAQEDEASYIAFKAAKAGKKGKTSFKVISFGYKFGVPPSGDSAKIIDLRKAIRNPWHEPKLRFKTGKDQEVQQFIKMCKGTKKTLDRIEFFRRVAGLSEQGMVIYVGCNGGKHRSVAIAEMAKVAHPEITIEHRDLEK